MSRLSVDECSRPVIRKDLRRERVFKERTNLKNKRELVDTDIIRKFV